MSKAQHPAPAAARRTTSLSVAPFEGFDRAASLAIPQEILDDQLALFTEGELKVLLSVIRATNGGQREAVPLSVRVLCRGGLADVLPGRGTGVSPRTVQAACTALENAGYLRVARRMSPDGSGLPSLFTLPLMVPGMAGGAEPPSPFPGYSAGRRVRLPLMVIDRLLSELSGAELKVLLYVLRHTFCVGISDEIMPMARLVENTGLSLRHTRLAVAGLAARGVILVQHRDDPERGKLPSRFGVRVLGEAAPFSALEPVPGLAARAVRPEEPQPRPIWLVPPVPEAPSAGETPTAPAPILQVLPPQAPSGGQPAPPIAAAVPAASAPAPPVERPGRAGPPAPRPIPPAMLRDNHPVWAAVKRALSQKLPYEVFSLRIASTASVAPGGPELLIAVQNEYHRWYLESKLGTLIRDTLAEEGYPDLRLRYLNYSGAIPTDPREA